MTLQLPAATIVSAPVVAFTVHTVIGVAVYDSAPSAAGGAVSVGAVPPTVTVAGSYSNPARSCSPFATIGNSMSTVAGLPAASLTVTVAVAVFSSAVLGVPLISPLLGSMTRPAGRSAAPYVAMSLPPDGLSAVIASPTVSEPGTV